MPIYEYRCEKCSRKFSVLVGVVAGGKKEKSVACPKCESKSVSRIISRVSFRRSEEDVLSDLGDPSKMGDLDDPKSLRKWTEKMGRQFGDDLGGDFQESLGGLEDEMGAGSAEGGGSFESGGEDSGADSSFEDE